jgi:hypothetical protein
MSKSGWLDRLAKAAEQRAEPTAEPRLQRASPEAPARSAPKPKQKPVVQLTWFQTRPASEGGDPGAVEPVFYSVVDGVLRIHKDEDGERTAHMHELREGEDPKQVASRIGKQRWLKSDPPDDFNRKLNYRGPSIA